MNSTDSGYVQRKNHLNSLNNDDDSSPMAKLIEIIPCQCQLGEGVLWHAQQQAIYWLDIESELLFKYSLATKNLEQFSLPYRLASFAFTATDNEIIAAFAQGIARYNIKTSTLTWLSQPELSITGNRLNDGKTDRQGRFWVGSIVEQAQSATQQAYLYCVDEHGQCQQKMSQLSISNGLCWNKDGTVLYHTDSPSHAIYQYDYCQESTNITNKRLFATTADNAFPDGATVDGQDYLWSAQWGSSKVVRYDHLGNIDAVLTLPISNPSCVAIGGKNLDLLIVTTAKQGLTPLALKAEPLAGNLFIYQLTGVTGLLEQNCRLYN